MTTTAILGLAAIVFMVLAICFWARYKTVGADEALIVTGSMLGGKKFHH